MAEQIYSLSIAARATLDTHSLNNEGGEGNQVHTRMIDVVGHDGRLYNVNAISGDMLKHIQAEHLFMLARERGLPMCAGCRQFNANRINADEQWMDSIKGLSDAQAIDSMLKTCIIDDISGILVTAGGRSIPRKSVVEFGWVLGLPDATYTDSYFHVKYASERSEEQRERDAARRVKENRETKEKTGGANLGQAIFHRPTSSGIYAIVCNLEFARIGYNDILQRYILNEDERRTRPLLSPLGGGQKDRETYREQTSTIARSLGGDAVRTLNFDSLAEFAEHFSNLYEETSPYTMRVGV